MRLYTFGNFYLSSIQQGIQAAHVTSSLFAKYDNELHDCHTPDYVLYEWAKKHHTIVCLNGGNAQNLEGVYAELTNIGNLLKLPYGKFHEDGESLGGIMTCCGIVVPANIYEAAEEMRNPKPVASFCDIDAFSNLSIAERDLGEFLNKFGLAR